MSELIKFWVNDWAPENDFPDEEPFSTWMQEEVFCDAVLDGTADKYCKANKICAVYDLIDQSVEFSVVAPREWVETVCPCIIGTKFEKKAEAKIGRFVKFPEYKESNYGCFFCKEVPEPKSKGEKI